SILAVPVLVYVAGQDPKAATATSLVLVTLTALVGIVPHARAGRVRFDKGILFSATGIAGTVVGTRLNHRVDPHVLLLAFAGLMVVVAVAMIRSARRAAIAPRAVGAAVATAPHVAAPLAEPIVVAPSSPSPSQRRAPALIARLVATGTVVGMLTGFFGVGGGFVIVPALVLALGFTMTEAVGTSMLVIVLNSMVALVARLSEGGVEWDVIAPFAIASISGVMVGSRLADRRDPRTLQGWFAGLLLAVAVYTAVRSLISL
ncbi:MAG: sulfite exporter TauE/SafE family protein, partial [Desertimonas sp.]